MSKTQTKQLTEPESFWAAVDALAKSEGVNRSEWIYDAGLAKMPPEVRETVDERRPMGRPVEK